MTENEARIARIAFELAADLHAYSSIPSGTSDGIREAFIKMYHPDQPCAYDLECIRTGRCPKNIACNN
jgi:hypothetical protein